MAKKPSLVPPPAVSPAAERLATAPLPTEEESKLLKLQLENHRLQLEIERLRTDVSRGRIDLWLRLGMAVGLFAFVCWYLAAVVELAGRPNGETRLTDAALIALFGSTAVNVIGLLLTVARYLFPGPPSKPDA